MNQIDASVSQEGVLSPVLYFLYIPNILTTDNIIIVIFIDEITVVGSSASETDFDQIRLNEIGT